MSSMEELLAKLELVSGKITGNSMDDGECPVVVQEYDLYYSASVQPFIDACKKDAAFAKLGEATEKAFKGQRNVIEATTQCAAPDQAGLMSLMAPIVEVVTACQDVDRRADTFAQDQAFSETIQCLNWLTTTMVAPTITGQLEAADFYLNKVLVAAKDKEDPEKTNARDFVKLLKKMLNDLAEFAKNNFKSGLTWKFKGIPASEFKPGQKAVSSGTSGASDPESRLAAILESLQRHAAKSSDDDGEGEPARVTAYKEYYAASVTPFLEACGKMEGTKKLGELTKTAWDHQGEVIKATSEYKKPAMDDFMKYLKPIVDVIGTASNPDRRSACANQEIAFSEAVQSLQWLVADVSTGAPPPRGTITAALESSDFYLNKVLTAAKDASDADKAIMRDFVKLLKAMLSGLGEYAFAHFKTGLEWNNAKGKDGKTIGSAAPAAAAPAAAAPAAAKPANPLAAMIANKAAAGGAAPKKAVAMKFGAAAVKKEPKIDRSQRHKIFVENYENAPEPVTVEVELSDGQPKTGVFVDKCKNSTIVLKGKCKNITISGCQKSGIVFDSCVTTIELINCKQVSVQAVEDAGTFTVDKSERTSIYLAEGSLDKGDVLVYTTQSSSTNVYQSTEDGEDQTEYGVPEQILSNFKMDTATTTEVVIPDAE